MFYDIFLLGAHLKFQPCVGVLFSETHVTVPICTQNHVAHLLLLVDPIHNVKEVCPRIVLSNFTVLINHLGILSNADYDSVGHVVIMPFYFSVFPTL